MKWEYRAGYYPGPGVLSPDGEVLYCGSGDNQLYAIDPVSLETLWTYDARSDVFKPVVDQAGNICFSSGDGNVSCVDPSGNLLWKTMLPGQTHSRGRYDPGEHTLAAEDERIYVGRLLDSGGGREADTVYCLNQSGDLQWSFEGGGNADLCLPSNVEPGGITYIADARNELFHAINQQGGVEWSQEITTNEPESGLGNGHWLRSAPLVDPAGNAYLSMETWDEYDVLFVNKYSPAGDLLWTHRVKDQPGDTWGRFDAAALYLDTDQILVAYSASGDSSRSPLRAINLDGSTAWETETVWVDVMTTNHAGNIFTGWLPMEGNGFGYSSFTSDGELRWEYDHFGGEWGYYELSMAGFGVVTDNDLIFSGCYASTNYGTGGLGRFHHVTGEIRKLSNWAGEQTSSSTYLERIVFNQDSLIANFGDIYCLDSNGELSWELTQYDQYIDFGAVLGVAGGRLYSTSYWEVDWETRYAQLVEIDMSTGNYAWWKSMPFGYYEFLIDDLIIVDGRYDQTDLEVYDLDGNKLWNFTEGNYSDPGPVAVHPDDWVAIAANDMLLSVDMDGEVLVERPYTGGSCFADNGDLVGTTWDGTLLTLHRYRGDGMFISDFTMERPYHYGANPLAIGADGTVYFSDRYGMIAVDRDGNLKWLYEGTYLSAPAVDGEGTIYITHRQDGNWLAALNPDGTTKWEFELPEIACAPVIAPNGNICVVSIYGTIHCIGEAGE